jgi:hypothetical protein
LKKDFELSNNSEDFVKSADIEAWIKEKKIGISMKKFGMEMKKYCIIHKLNYIQNGNKRIFGKQSSVWFGLKAIIENTSEE